MREYECATAKEHDISAPHAHWAWAMKTEQKRELGGSCVVTTHHILSFAQPLVPIMGVGARVPNDEQVHKVLAGREPKK